MVPSLLVSGQQTQVTLTCYVKGADQNTQVQLFSLASGSPTLIGNMNDAGQNGDQEAGDQVYTIVASLIAPATSSLPMQVTATTGTGGSVSTNFSVTIVQIPTYSTDTDVNQAESNLYNTAIQTRSTFSNPDWSNQTLTKGISNNLVSMFTNLSGVVNQNSTLQAAAVKRVAPFDASFFEARTPQPDGIGQNILSILTFGLLSPAQNASSCNQLIRSLGDLRGQPGYPPPLDTSDPQLITFATELANLCPSDSQCQSLAPITYQDLIGTDNPAAVEWAREFMLTGPSLPTPVDGCGGGEKQSVTNVAVTDGVSQYTDLAGDGFADLTGGGQIAQTAVSQTGSTLLEGFLVNGSGTSSVVVGNAGSNATFAMPAGTYNLAVSFGGSNANGTITNTPVYPNSTTNISPSPGTNITVTPPYVTGVTPSYGTVGTIVTINGTGFDTNPSGNDVTFDGVAAQVASSTATSIQTTVPDGATSGPLSVATASGSTTSSGSFTVTGITATHTITVGSTNPNSGVSISASPADNNGQNRGTTQFTLTYDSGAVVTLSAPTTANGDNFSSWVGCDSASGTTCTVAMNADRAVAANFSPPGTATLTVSSTNPTSGASITASPKDNSGSGGGTTSFTLTYNTGTTVTLTPGATVGGNSFSTWSGCDSVSGTTCTVTVNANRTATANYGRVPAFVYVANQNSGDISAYTVDPTNGALTSAGSFTSGLAPASVAADPTAPCLYVANSQDPVTPIAVFSIDLTTGALVPGQSPPMSVLEVDPVSIAMVPKGTFVFVANYSGNVSVFSVNSATCALTEISGSPFPAGTLPQAVAIDPTGNSLYVANLSDNDLSAYSVASTTGGLTPIAGSPYMTGSAPTAVAIDPSGKFVYVANSFDDTFSVFTRDTTTGALTSLGLVATDGAPFSVAVDPTDKFVFVPYLGSPGAVEAFALDTSTGVLTKVGGFTAGDNPEFVAVDPSGKFVYATNNGSSSVSEFVIDPNTGALSPVPGNSFPAGGGPVSVAVTAKSPAP